ncbi:GID complex subunit containing RING finger motif [Pyrenophora teres f. teres]|nr:GID complex subunit containing RING finger motif [Pyrenophora teres f. teres]
MAELMSTKLNAESHLLLDQPLLRMPYELSRRNFKTPNASSNTQPRRSPPP